MAAIDQMKRLAAIHDPTGDSFNVGPVTVGEDGKVRSVKKATPAGEEENPLLNPAGGVNPERIAMLKQLESETVKAGMSKRAMEKRRKLLPKPVPTKPVLPAGISIPEGEEDFLALWDITDQEVETRIHSEAKRKSAERKKERKQSKIEAKFNRAMKIKRRAAMKMGIAFDAEQAKKDILGAQSEESDDDSNSNSESESEEGSETSDSEDEDDKIRATTPATIKVKKGKESKESEEPFLASGLLATLEKSSAKVTIPEADTEESKKRPSSDDAEEPKAKKSKKNSASFTESEKAIIEKRQEEKKLKELESKKLKKEKKLKAQTPEEIAAKEAKKAKSNAKKAARAARKAGLVPEAVVEQAVNDNKPADDVVVAVAPEKSPDPAPSKKRKIKEDDTEEPAEKKPKKKSKTAAITAEPASQPSEKKTKKSKKTVEAAAPEDAPASAAAQWNPEALDGDDQRKSKFLRLLGAGKSSVGAAAQAKATATGKLDKKADIEKVQRELEKQYESGVYKKESGGKRRGLGA